MEIKNKFEMLDNFEQEEMIIFLLEGLRSGDPEARVNDACQTFIDEHK